MIFFKELNVYDLIVNSRVCVCVNSRVCVYIYIYIASHVYILLVVMCFLV